MAKNGDGSSIVEEADILQVSICLNRTDLDDLDAEFSDFEDGKNVSFLAFHSYLYH